MKYPTKTSYWKTFEKNNPTIALNILYIKEKEICPSYIPKINSSFEKQIILIIIPDDKKGMASSCSKTIISIITWNNFKT